MKLKDVLDKSIQFFKEKKMDTPRLDAELLIAFALNLERMQLYMKYEAPLTETEITNCREVIKRRSQGEPVAYITGDKGFYGFVFKVGSGVLVPRPETEHLVELALDFIKTQKISNPKILDLGAGSGCVGFSILKNHPESTLVSVEKSPEAFFFLQENCKTLDLQSRTQLILKNANDLEKKDLGSFDIILANPPYIDKNDPAVESAVRKFEPEDALFAESNGLAFLTAWSQQFSECLKTPGLMAFEMGYLQGLQMVKNFNSLNIFSHVEIVKDLSGLDRIIKGVRY